MLKASIAALLLGAFSLNVVDSKAETFLQTYAEENYNGNYAKTTFGKSSGSCYCVRAPGTKSVHWDLNWSAMVDGRLPLSLELFVSSDCTGFGREYLPTAGWGDQANWIGDANNDHTVANSAKVRFTSGWHDPDCNTITEGSHV
ncbi:hypothetical protein BGZ65_013037 [Modicella reniformis]|uniref:Uncharacterized protein n=1 Tax=Modicella reniformis TaxID=1440133 RepID=A0A9P6SUV7_9FUNG|nr:hypothetical protein BGZ65_013037 [Modicella reniformis]